LIHFVACALNICTAFTALARQCLADVKPIANQEKKKEYKDPVNLFPSIIPFPTFRSAPFLALPSSPTLPFHFNFLKTMAVRFFFSTQFYVLNFLPPQYNQQPRATQPMQAGGSRNANNLPLVDGQREWSYGVFDCLADPLTCKLSIILPDHSLIIIDNRRSILVPALRLLRPQPRQVQCPRAGRRQQGPDGGCHQQRKYHV
jgi:hypothetical protein